MTSGWGSLNVNVGFDDDPLEAAPTFTSVFGDVEHINIIRGKSSPSDDLYSAGTCTVRLDDFTGKYNPSNTAGTYYGKLLPRRQVQVTINDSVDDPHTLFKGHVVPRGWENEPELPGMAHTTMTAADFMSLAGQCDLPETEPANPTEYMVIRVLEVMTLAGIGFGSPWWQFLTVPNNETGVKLGDVPISGKLLPYLQTMARSDGGHVWCTRENVLTVEQRLVQFVLAARTTPVVTFADDGTGVYYDTVTPDYAQEIVNTARRAGVSGNVQDVTDGTSETTLTGIATSDDQLDLQVHADPEAYERAALKVLLFKDEYYGPAAIRFKVEDDDSLDALCALEVRSRVAVKYTPPGLSQATTEHLVERIQITIPVTDSPNEIVVELGLSPAASLDVIDGTEFLVWGDDWDVKVFTP